MVAACYDPPLMRRQAVGLVLVSGALAAATTLLSAQATEIVTPTFGLTPATSTIVFHPPAPLPNPERPATEFPFAAWSGRGFAIGDFTGDGLNDIAVAATYLRFQPRLPLRFWVNQGDGTFADKTAEILDGAPPEIGGPNMYVADFNRDGRTDLFIVDAGLEDKLATTGFDGSRNHVILSQPDGRLKDTSGTSLPGDPIAFNHVSTMADVNNDGAMDMVIERLGGPRMPGSGAVLLLNDGTGRFTQTTQGLPREIAYLPTVEASAVADRHVAGSVGACDLDGNGRTDLITASYVNTFSPRNVRVFEQTATTSFVERFRTPLPPEIIQLAAQRTNLTVGAAGVVCGDLNGDGLGDIAIHWETNGADTFVQFLRNKGGFQFEDATLDWFGSWTTSYAVRSGTKAVNALDLRDVNGDGALDFVPKNGGNYEPSTLWDGAFAFLNDGTGHFRGMGYQPTNASVTVTDLARAIGCTGFCSIRPLLFDATGDGQTDLVLIETWTLRSSDPPIREDRVLIHTLRGQVGTGASLRSVQRQRSRP